MRQLELPAREKKKTREEGREATQRRRKRDTCECKDTSKLV